MTFDFLSHRLIIETSDGARDALPLAPRSVADFYRELMSTLDAMGLPVRICSMPVELAAPVRFEEDRHGNLVLTGDTKGNFLAFDARDGKVLLKKHLGDPIGGGIVTYEIDGRQYVAVPGGMKNTVTQQTDSGPAWVSILALPAR